MPGFSFFFKKEFVGSVEWLESIEPTLDPSLDSNMAWPVEPAHVIPYLKFKTMIADLQHTFKC